MKLQLLQEQLEKAVNITSRFVSTKSQLPILGNILFSTRKSKIFISSTNLEISASVQVGANIEKEGEICIPSKVIFDLVSNLPKEIINLEAEKEQLKISVNGFSSTILGMNAIDFPKVPSFVNNDKTVSFSREEFSEALSKVGFAASTDETRPVLTGVLFILNEDSLSLVATDGFRLSRNILNIKGLEGKEKHIIIPKGILSEIGRGIFESDSLLFNLEEKDKQVVFGLGNSILSSRLLEGEYPDFEKIIPGESAVKVILDKEEFLRSVKLASIFARESANIVKLKILKDCVKVFAESGQAGSQETKVDAKIKKNSSGDENFEISFNYRYLEDFVHSVSGEELEMGFLNPNSAGVFKDTNDSNYLHLIMPVKV